MGFPSFSALPSMLIERQAEAVVVWAPAKVNLHLEVLARRPDGYHEIASLMVTVNLHDTLVFQEGPGPEIRLDCDHPGLESGPGNLVSRAGILLQGQTGCRHGANIRLVKRIPLAAGLAGGSSDAAATLAGLNRLWRLGLKQKELARLGAELGSDVAFFFQPPAAWCTGRGEQVQPLDLGRPLWLVLVCPGQGLSTAEVYRNLTVPEKPHTGEAIREAFAAGEVEAIGRHLHNRLQPVAEQLCPELSRWREQLRHLQPAGCLMSGSGTTLFALCRNRDEAVRVYRQLRPEVEERVRLFLVRSSF